MNDWCSCNRLMKAEEKAAKWDAIVRCGECKHYDEDAGFCTRFREIVEEHLDLDWPYQIPEWGYLESTPDDYCSWGKRKEDA